MNQPLYFLIIHHVSPNLIFKNQPNLVIDSGTHPSRHPNCCHQIIHCKINLQVEIHNLIKDIFGIMLKLIRMPSSALQNVVWHRLFANATVHQQVILLNDIILNAFTIHVMIEFHSE